MRLRFSLGLLLLSAVLLAPVAALAQQPEQPVFTFVAAWGVPRNQWDAWEARWNKNIRPVLERFAGDATLVSWGSFATMVHELDGLTHGVWFQAHSIAALERVHEELIKLPADPALTPTKHRDWLLRSLIHQAKTSRPGAGYLLSATSVVKPGKGGEWRELWEKYNKGLYDETLANGTITYYAVDVEQIHLEDPGLRYIVYITSSAEGVDKFRAAQVARSGKRSAEENRAIGQAFADLTVAGAHRDYLARVLAYWHK